MCLAPVTIPLLIQKRNIRSLLWIYLIPLSVVILITTYKHSLFYFDLESSHLVMYPFFKDHTRYGAVIAMMLPMAIYLYSSRKNVLLLCLANQVLLINFKFRKL